MDCVQITTAIGSREAAEAMALALVEARLVACAQVVGPVASTYRWQSAVERAEEWLCHLKTTRARRDEAVAAIRARHSYELPEIISVPIEGTPEYVQWIADQVAA
ncbi:MAG TPA: divalent-cation tolerance protein CutA [Gemmatimonadales bacterium]|nr:divalent-cation tolerance protein CutA [Gemmatimonadales bacterium]